MKKYVVHCQHDKYDIYIGRPSVWGNPFSHKSGTLAKYRVKTRAEAIKNYREWFLNQPELVEKAKIELKGKVLGCWCKESYSCHGDILAEVANEEEVREEISIKTFNGPYHIIEHGSDEENEQLTIPYFKGPFGQF